MFEVKTTGPGLGPLREALQSADGIELHVGSLDPQVAKGSTPLHRDRDGEAGELTVAGVLRMHEFGTRDLPRRPVVLATVALKRSALGDEAADALGKIVDGEADGAAFKAVGHMMAMAMRRTIEGGVAPAVESETASDADRRAGAPPLNDTGQMAASIHWRAVSPDGSVKGGK